MIKKMTNRAMNPATKVLSERCANICASACFELCKMGLDVENIVNAEISIKP